MSEIAFVVCAALLTIILVTVCYIACVIGEIKKFKTESNAREALIEILNLISDEHLSSMGKQIRNLALKGLF